MQMQDPVTEESLLESLSCELQLVILEYVDGASVVRASVAVRVWRRYALCEEFWCSKVCCELKAPCLGDRWSTEYCKRKMPERIALCSDTVSEASDYSDRSDDGEIFWEAKYRNLVVPKKWRLKWRRPTTRHGLGDRVAAPQLFVGPQGRKLFSYGGWSVQGPQSDLHYVNLDALNNRLRFTRVPETGRPCRRRGVQTLTPLWRGERGEGPSQDHISSVFNESEGSLILALGGAGGGYAAESSDWRIGYLDETAPSIHWLDNDDLRCGDDESTPLPRGAHTATYVPARLLDGQHPEGAVFVLGGHADDCTRSLTEVDKLDIATWKWTTSDDCSRKKRGRHGHSAALVEVDGRAFIVLIGGGTGNILHGFGGSVAEFDDCDVYDATNNCWVGPTLPLNSVFGRHHTACHCLGDRYLLFGGGSRPSNTCALFDARLAVQTALSPSAEDVTLVQGVPALRPQEQPRARKMHAACCLLPYVPCFCVYGGWEFGPHFADFWIADMLPDSVVSSSTPVQRTHSDDGSTTSSDDIEDHEDIVVINVATDSGDHQVRIPRSVFNRLVEDGFLATSHEDTSSQDTPPSC